MCVVIDLDVVCLICLQPSKEMHPIFTADVDNPELQIAQKISILSELKIDQDNQTLPSKICGKCLQDLKAAWRFRKNCQAAITIFETIVKLDDIQTQAEEVSGRELAEEEIEGPEGFQIRRLNNSGNEAEERKKAGETLIRKKAAVADEFVIHNGKVGSTIYEELVPNQHSEPDEFQTLHNEQENESEEFENEDEETTLMEYYITEEGVSNETSVKIDNVITKIKAELEETQSRFKKQTTNKDIENRKTKQIVYLENISKPQVKVHSKRQNVHKNMVKISQIDEKEITGTIVTESKPAKLEVRQVKTRKRKSCSLETKTPKICELCGNSYRFQHALNAHMRRHYNDKQFPCELCDKAFVSNVELRRHMRVHTGQKPYACQYCDRRFSDFGSRIKHERTHTGERPYHCITCGKSFAYPHVLSVHVRTHTGEKRFRCDHCSKGFTKKAYLLSHVEAHHSGPKKFHVEDTAVNSSQKLTMKSDSFEECIYTTEFVNEESIDEEDEYEEDEGEKPGKIIITESPIEPKIETDDYDDDDSEVHEIVEVEPDEYTIRVR